MELVDVHAHLEEISDLYEALERASEAGVTSVIAVGSDLESNRAALDLAGEHGGLTVHPALGLHPWRLETEIIDPALDFVASHIGQAVAVGETGLDGWLRGVRRNAEKMERQKGVFRRLLELAAGSDRPAIIHSRGAWRESLELAVSQGVRKAVFHWFSGPPDVLSDLLAAGYFISATPAAAASEHHRRSIRKAPLERILLETDAPARHGGRPSEPADVTVVLRAVSELKGVSPEEAAAVTTASARQLFGF